MTLPRTAADVLARHVLFEVESIDRLYLNVYVPELQRVGQVVGFLTRHRGFEIASTALVAPMSEAFIAGIRGYARDHEVPLIDFVKGQRKDDVMHAHLARCDGSEQVLFIGRAQEKARIFRTERRRNPTTGAAYPWIVTATAMVNQFYVYVVDEDFGPFFLKFSSYFPVRHEAPCNRVEVSTCTDTPSQRRGEAGGSLIRETPVRAASSPDNGGTRRHSRTAWVRLARRKGVREEPAF
jgi:hypothetical protein